MKYRDDVCRLGKCPNCEICAGLCPPLQYVNGRSQSKEILLSNLIRSDNVEYRDYKEVITELSEDREAKRSKRLEKALKETNTRKKFIKIALLAGYTQAEISLFFKLTPGRICQIIKS